jgi:sterol 3beta-glucosyltransferase
VSCTEADSWSDFRHWPHERNPMRAVLTNFGTMGEIYPLLALGQELARNGHECTLALSPEYQVWASRLGMDFVPIGPPLSGIQRKQTLAVARNQRLFDSLEAMMELWSPLKELLPRAYTELMAAAEGADVLISGHLQPASRVVHETTGMPYISVCATYLAPKATSPAYRHATRWMVNPLREQLGLKPLADPLAVDSLSGRLILFALSEHVTPQPPDWPSRCHFTGYFRLREENWHPDPSLCEFLEAGEAPVALSFGSMALDNPDAVTDVVFEAVHLARCRMVIQRGWAGLGQQGVPETVRVIDYAPHDWLFPKASCVIHHGGAGTSAAMFCAGVPGIFVPYILDMPFWATCAERLGCAGPAIPPSCFTARNLASQINATVRNPGYRLAAQQLCSQLRKQSGVRTARLLIEEALR